MSAVTRANLAARAVTVWLRADLELLFQQVARRNIACLTPPTRGHVKSLMDHRYPVYGMADIVVDSANVAVEETTAAVERALADFWAAPKPRERHSHERGGYGRLAPGAARGVGRARL